MTCLGCAVLHVCSLHLQQLLSPQTAMCLGPLPQVPIAPYLVALAVGQLESRELGPRTRVWSEPSMVDAGGWHGGVLGACVLALLVRWDTHPRVERAQHGGRGWVARRGPELRVSATLVCWGAPASGVNPAWWTRVVGRELSEHAVMHALIVTGHESLRACLCRSPAG